MQVISSLSAYFILDFIFWVSFFIFAQVHGCVRAEEENVNKIEQIVVKAHLSCYIVIKINS